MVGFQWVAAMRMILSHRELIRYRISTFMEIRTWLNSDRQFHRPHHIRAGDMDAGNPDAEKLPAIVVQNELPAATAPW
jgi:hypothetical protein